MRIIFCGGGTVGHITPAIAIAETIKEYDRSADILFIGREGGEENESIKKEGFKLKCIKICGIKRKITTENIKNILIALSSRKKSAEILKEFAPDIVVGTGGYVCWPVISVANKLKIPTIIHESNATPGLVTKILAPKCTRVLLNLSGSERKFKRKDNIRIVGNPSKNSFTAIDKKTARKHLGISENEFMILSFGGSGGSKVINDTIIEAMNEYSQKDRLIRHIHASGRKYYDEIKTKNPKLTRGVNGCIIKQYIEDMSTYMSAADIVISRCGAMTLTEIAATSTASILIPSPNVTNNHQYENADLLKKQGAAIMIEESDLSATLLINQLKRIKENIKLRRDIEKEVHKTYKKDSKKLILNEIIGVLNRGQ